MWGRPRRRISIVIVRRGRSCAHAMIMRLVVRTVQNEPATDSRYAWSRLAVTLALMTIGSSGMYVVSVVLPAVQAEFGVDRAAASLPYTLLMVGFGLGGVLMGRLADRRGVVWPLFIGAAGLAG